MEAIFTLLQPVLVEVLLSLILGGIIYLLRFLPSWMRINIEAKHREALHSALTTGVQKALGEAKEETLFLRSEIACSEATCLSLLSFSIVAMVVASLESVSWSSSRIGLRSGSIANV